MALNNRSGLLIAGGAIAATGAIALATFLGVKSATSDQIEKWTIPATSQNSEDYANTDDPAQMSSAQFDTLTHVQQMDYAGKKINESTADNITGIKSLISDTGWTDYEPFDREIVGADIGNTPQEIWDQITLGYYQVWKTAQDGSLEEAKKLARGVVDGQEYDDLVGILANGGSPILEAGIGHEDGAFPAKVSGEYEGVDANGLGVVSFIKESTTTKEFDQVRVVAQLRQGNEPNSKRWILVKTIPVSAR